MMWFVCSRSAKRDSSNRDCCGYVFHNDIDVRREAIIALRRIGAESAVPVLEEVLQREHEAHRNKYLAEEAVSIMLAGGLST